MSDIKEMLEAKAKAEETKKPAEVQVKAKKAGPEYAAGRLRRIIRSNGTSFMPTAAGVYAPDNRDDYELCEYYVSAGVLERLD